MSDIFSEIGNAITGGAIGGGKEAEGSGGSFGSLLANQSQHEYQIQIYPVSAGSEEQSMDYPEIMDKLHGLNPEEVADAADSFHKLGDQLDTVAAQLADAGNKVADKWSGTAASKAMQSFQQLHDQAAQLAAQAHTTGNTVQWVSQDVMPVFKTIQSPQVMGGGSLLGGAEQGGAAGTLMGGIGIAPGVAGGAALAELGRQRANNAARQYLSALNQHLVTANNQLPASTATQPPAGSQVGHQQFGNSGHGSSSGSSSSGGGSGGGSVNPYASSGGVGHADGGGSTGGSLQGYSPLTGGSTASPFGTGSPGGLTTTGGGSTNPFSRVPTVPGENHVPSEDIVRNYPEDTPRQFRKDVPPENENTDGPAGTDGAANAAEAKTADASGESGMMPAGGAGGGSQEKERQRQAWLKEDDSIWGVPDTDIGSTIE